MKNKNEPKWTPFKKSIAKKNASGLKKIKSEKSERFFNRDISWLTFNDRVLAEASKNDVPLLERLSFIGIVSSNLDEFFSVRVADLLKRLKKSPHKPYIDALTPESLSLHVRERVMKQKAMQAKILNGLLKKLEAENIIIYTSFEKSDAELDTEIEQNFPEAEIFFSKLSEPLPILYGTNLHIFVRFRDSYAIVRFKNQQERLLKLRNIGKKQRFALLDRWIMAKAEKIFKHKEVLEIFSFRFLRNADIIISDSEDEVLTEQIIKGVKKRSSSQVVRLEIDAPKYPDSAFFLAANLGIDPASIYRFDLPLQLHFFTSFKKNFIDSKLIYPPLKPVIPKVIEKDPDIFSVISKQDIILHHPYDSFDVVTDFISQASQDPNVTEIFHMLYRTSDKTPITEALKKAAKNGKKVTVYVEIKARFDEMNNVMHSDDLKNAGVEVVEPITDYKVHSKITLVSRIENGIKASYAHLGTGNYHSGTAKQYTDLGLLTKNTEITKEAGDYCAMIKSRKTKYDFQQLLISPINMHEKIISLIEDEISYVKNGGKGHIIAKLNALTDIEVIEKLYKASNAGVHIDLIVRGMCCLKPKVPKQSENIRVVSIVDRFLEHSRIFYFRANGSNKVYLSSADWRPRNFHRRYELAFPILDSNIKKYICDVILYNNINDNVRGRTLNADGTYSKVRSSAKNIRAQLFFENLAKSYYKNTPLYKRNLLKP